MTEADAKKLSISRILCFGLRQIDDEKRRRIESHANMPLTGWRSIQSKRD